MAGFWDYVSTGIDLIQGQIPGTPGYGGGGGAGFGGGGGNYPVDPGPMTPPQKVTVDTRTGKITPCRRRRRRRLLTASDINDLAALKAIVGGGQAMNLAVAKAVRGR